MHADAFPTELQLSAFVAIVIATKYQSAAHHKSPKCAFDLRSVVSLPLECKVRIIAKRNKSHEIYGWKTLCHLRHGRVYE